jgi:hypothetical protein
VITSHKLAVVKLSDSSNLRTFELLLIDLLTIDFRSGTSGWRYQHKQATKGSVSDHLRSTNDQLNGLGATSEHGNFILNVEKFSAKLWRSEGGKTKTRRQSGERQLLFIIQRMFPRHFMAINKLESRLARLAHMLISEVLSREVSLFARINSAIMLVNGSAQKWMFCCCF